MKKVKARRLASSVAAALAAGLIGSAASAANVYNVYITEWMYTSTEENTNLAHEYIELTNLGATAVDFTGWSYDDDSRNVGVFSLSALGIVNPGESVLLTEAGASVFRSIWNVSDDVKILGNLSPNLGRNDEINIFDSSGTLVDRLAFGDQDLPGSIRARDRGGVPGSVDALGANDVYQWVLTNVPDAYGSWVSSEGLVGNPGTTHFSPVPLPAAAWLLLSGIVGLVGVGRRRLVTA